MRRNVASRAGGLLSRVRRMMVRVVVVLVLGVAPAAALARAQPPATTAAQDGFVPVDESKPQEHLPAAPLVIAAYGLAWMVIFGYVWSLWSRLSRVEREIVEVRRRMDAANRR